MILCGKERCLMCVMTSQSFPFAEARQTRTRTLQKYTTSSLEPDDTVERQYFHVNTDNSHSAQKNICEQQNYVMERAK